MFELQTNHFESSERAFLNFDSRNKICIQSHIICAQICKIIARSISVHRRLFIECAVSCGQAPRALQTKPVCVIIRPSWSRGLLDEQSRLSSGKLSPLARRVLSTTDDQMQPNSFQQKICPKPTWLKCQILKSLIRN